MTTMKDIVEPLPYVTSATIVTWCDGWTSNGNRPRKCQQRGFYHFRKSSTKGKGRHKSGYFCSTCLIKVLNYSVYEKERHRRAIAKFQKEAANEKRQ